MVYGAGSGQRYQGCPEGLDDAHLSSPYHVDSHIGLFSNLSDDRNLGCSAFNVALEQVEMARENNGKRIQQPVCCGGFICTSFELIYESVARKAQHQLSEVVPRCAAP
ncbi:hypothetical protein C8F04DRAFT_1179236 [Mycena alexandri]|uniref:Uncharacterized protein n=1 Tax=Mycena alexandri TaxID=1745969 RepID=A0AAD6T6X9_9AGAR|nr:hypothetical protein C8F04DRAFT_1179236 [Mycena alexandri]